jgi:hypothetical protein
LVQPGHLQIESTVPQQAPGPITETSYLSWFTAPALVQESSGPVAFVLQWLDAEAAGPARHRPKATGSSSVYSAETLQSRPPGRFTPHTYLRWRAPSDLVSDLAENSIYAAAF